jgi:hypothetical protein
MYKFIYINVYISCIYIYTIVYNSAMKNNELVMVAL